MVQPLPRRAHGRKSLQPKTEIIVNTVKVKREDLLTRVRANRDAHRELFLKAQTNYRRFIIEELDRMLADAKANRSIRRSINLVEPRDHTADYDRTIMMLEMSVDDTIILNATEFDQYVRDLQKSAKKQRRQIEFKLKPRVLAGVHRAADAP